MLGDLIIRKTKTLLSLETHDKSKLPQYAINLTGSPNSTVIKIKKMKFRALVDSGVINTL